MTTYAQHITGKASKKKVVATTSVAAPIPSRKKEMKLNDGGGYSFVLTPMKTLERFLILGVDGSSYSAHQKKVTIENAKVVQALLAKGEGRNVVDMVVDISVSRRALKNDPSIFALALCVTYGDQETKNLAYAAITKVCRTGTDLFTFVESVNSLRGWSKGLRKGVAAFYTAEDEKSFERVGYQLTKYRQRNGWTHRDVMRLAHPTSKNEAFHNLIRYGKEEEYNEVWLPEIVKAFEKAQKASSEKELVKIIAENKNLTWEHIPTQFLKSAAVWEALLPNLPMKALLRNLGKLSQVGLIDTNLKVNTTYVAAKLQDPEQIRKSKIHPMDILIAWKVFQKGSGIKGDMSWHPTTKITDALEKAFHLAFPNVTPSGKNFVMAIDVSGSMEWTPHNINGVLSCLEAAAAMALIRLKVEPSVELFAFSSSLVRVPVTPSETLSSLLEKLRKISMGSTNASLPIAYATQQKWQVDVFEMYTDNDANTGIHPAQAIRVYRKEMKKPSTKFAVYAMAAKSYSLADPNDPNMMDFVGFDTSTPVAAQEFYKG